MRVASSLLVSALLLVATAGVAGAGDADPFEQPVQGRANALPDGAATASPDDLEAGASDPDAHGAEAGDPDARLAISGEEVTGHAGDPDARTIQATDLSELPSAASIDDVPAAIGPAPSLPAGCAQPAGNSGWGGCLAAIQADLDAARLRLAEAEAAYSRSITRHVPTGEARLAIIQDRDAARSEIASLTTMLSEQVDRARAAGASWSAIEPYASTADEP